MGLNFKKNMSLIVRKSQLIYPAVVLGAVFAACTPEPARRSAVDSGKTCSNDPDRPVWGGTCLQTQASAAKGSDDSRGIPERPVPEVARPETPVRPELPAPPEPLAPPAPAPVRESPEAQDAAVMNEVTKAIEGATPAIVDGLGKVLNGGGPKPGTPAKTEPQGAPTYVVSFSKDSFVGIADNSVIKNCFVSSGSVFEVKGEPKKITEFSRLGVNQYVTGETLDVNVSGGIESCELKGKDFVFLSEHAAFTLKP